MECRESNLYPRRRPTESYDFWNTLSSRSAFFLFCFILFRFIFPWHFHLVSRGALRDRDKAYRFFVVQVSSARDHVSQSVPVSQSPRTLHPILSQGPQIGKAKYLCTCMYVALVHLFANKHTTGIVSFRSRSPSRQQGICFAGVYGVYGAPESRNALPHTPVGHLYSHL